MGGERFALAGALWAAVLLGLWVCRRQSPLHLAVLALFATGLVGSFFPLMTLFVEPSTWRNVSGIPPHVVLATQVDYLAYAAGLLAACLIASQLGWLRTSEPDERREQTEWVVHRDLAVSAGMVLLGGALYGFYVYQVGLAPLTNRFDYAQKYLVSAGLGPLTFGLPMMIAGCLWAEGSEMSRRRKNLFLAVGLAIAVWSIAFISVRTNLVILMMGYAFIVCRRRRVTVRAVRPGLVVLLIVGYLGLEGFSLFRGVYRGDLRDAVQVLESQGETALASVVGGSELSHPFITTAEVRTSAMPGELAGRSYVDGVLALVPRSLNPDRPLTLSERFVWSHYAWVAAVGGGRGLQHRRRGLAQLRERVGGPSSSPRCSASSSCGSSDDG